MCYKVISTIYKPPLISLAQDINVREEIVAEKILTLEMDDHRLVVCTENSAIKICSSGVHFQIISTQTPEFAVHLRVSEERSILLLFCMSLP